MIISITLKYEYKSKLTGMNVTTKPKFTRGKHEGEKSFMKKINRIIKSCNAEIIDKEIRLK